MIFHQPPRKWNVVIPCHSGRFSLLVTTFWGDGIIIYRGGWQIPQKYAGSNTSSYALGDVHSAIQSWIQGASISHGFNFLKTLELVGDATVASLPSNTKSIVCQVPGGYFPSIPSMESPGFISSPSNRSTHLNNLQEVWKTLTINTEAKAS